MADATVGLTIHTNAPESTAISVNGREFDPPRIIVGVAAPGGTFELDASGLLPFDRQNHETGETERVEGIVTQAGVCRCSRWLWGMLLSKWSRYWTDVAEQPKEVGDG